MHGGNVVRVVACAWALNAWAGTPCAEYFSPRLGRTVGYCVDRSRPERLPERNEPVVYFFHGAMMDSRHWYEMGYSLSLHRMAKEDAKFPALTVVSFDTHPLSFFSDRAGATRGPFSFETWFTEEFLPFAERRLRVCPRRDCRGLLGTSMGGFGAIKTALRHPELFAFAGGVASAILPAPLYSRTREEWDEYFADRTVGRMIGRVFIDDLRDIFPDAASWGANDPVEIVENWDASREAPALFFAAGGADEFGFADGYHRFRDALERRGFAYRSAYDPEARHFQVGGLREASLQFIGEAAKRSGM